MLSWIGSQVVPRYRNNRRARGFTLLEVIVAFTILSVALIGLLQAFATGMRGLGAAQASATAVMHARSKLDEIGEVIPLEDSEVSGEYDDGYRWEVRITRIEEGAEGLRVVVPEDLGTPEGGISLRGATNFRTPEGWDTIYTSVFNQIERPIAPMMVIPDMALAPDISGV